MMIVCCIQDNFYLSWQAELLALNCRELGHDLTILTGWRGEPSDHARHLQRHYNAVLIEDSRADISSAPSIQPHLLATYSRTVAPGPAPVFLVDSDVLFKSLDFLAELTTPDTVYLSDCCSYLNADYVNGTDPDLLGHLCGLAGIDRPYVEQHRHSGGAQYLLPHLFTPEFWEQIEATSNAMYRLLQNYTCSIHPVQVWTASMWAILYALYLEEKRGSLTVATSDLLRFCFATDPAIFWQQRDILHMAGVTPGLKGHFYKGDYTQQAPWDCDLGHVQRENCSWIYVEGIKRLKTKKID